MNRTKGLIWAKKVGFAVVIAAALLLTIHSALAASLITNQTSGSGLLWDSTIGYEWKAQTFTVSDYYNITNISLYIKEKNTADYIDVWLYSTSGGVPDSAIAYYGRYNLTVGGDTLRWQNFSKAGFQVESGETYAIVWTQGDTTQDYANIVNVSSSYDGEAYYGSASPPTTIYGSSAFAFQVYGNVTIPVYNKTLILDFKDEITEDLINDTIIFELISSSNASNYTTINGYLNVTVSNDINYTLRYRAANYPERDYYKSFNINLTENLTLYGLAYADSKDLIITVKDTTGESIENAKISLLRYFITNNSYKIVEMAYTDYAGKAWLSAEPYEGHYKIAVDYNGINYFLSSSPTNFIPDPVYDWYTQTITINLDTDFYESFRALTGFGDLLVYNETTHALSYTWSDPSGLTTEACLEVTYIGGVRELDYATSCGSGATGSVFIVLNNTATTSYKYRAYIETSTTYSDHTRSAGWIRPDPTYDFGVFGAFMSAFIIAGLALLFSYSAIAVLIITVVGVAVMSLLGLFPVGQAAILGLGVLVIGMSVYLYRRNY